MAFLNSFAGPTCIPLHVSGLDRYFVSRDDGLDPASPPTDAVIWLHDEAGDPGLDGSDVAANRTQRGELHLARKVSVDPTRLDVAPVGLQSHGIIPSGTLPGAGWGLPGQPGLPGTGAPATAEDILIDAMWQGTVSRYHDLYFLARVVLALRFGIRADPTHPVYPWAQSIQRIWVASASKGSSLAWAAYAFNNYYGSYGGPAWMEPLAWIRGFFLSSFGSPRHGVVPGVDGYGWDVRSYNPIRRPIAVWHGSPLRYDTGAALYSYGANVDKANDQFTQLIGFAKPWWETANDLTDLFPAGWRTGLPNDDGTGRGWSTALDYYRLGVASPADIVCNGADPALALAPEDYDSTGASMPLGLGSYYDPVADHGRVRRRFGAPGALIAEYEVIGGQHAWIAPCLTGFWDESQVATRFFRNFGHGR